jgi:sarcosine oxidase
MGVAGGHSQHGAKDFVGFTIDIARRHRIGHEILTAGDIRSRYPQFDVDDGTVGYFEPEAGYLRPEECVTAQLEMARRHGAVLRTNDTVVAWTSSGNAVTVTTDKGEYTAWTLVVCAGPWIGEVVPELQALFSVHRQVQYWFDLADPDDYPAYHELPIHIWIYGRGPDEMVYGFPAIDGPAGGMKIAGEQFLATTSPDAVQRAVEQVEIDETFQRRVRHHYPGLDRRVVKAVSCLYTVTSDFRFVIDRHPEHSNVMLASPCSGHGFKHSAAIGEALAQLTIDGVTMIDIEPFRLGRLRP